MSLKIIRSMTAGNLVFLQGANTRIDALVRKRVNDLECEQTGTLQANYTVKVQLDRDLTHMGPPRAEQIEVSFDGIQWNCVYCTLDDRVGQFPDQHRYYLQECPPRINAAIYTSWERTRDRTALRNLSRLKPKDFPRDDRSVSQDELALLRLITNDLRDLADQEQGAS